MADARLERGKRSKKTCVGSIFAGRRGKGNTPAAFPLSAAADGWRGQFRGVAAGCRAIGALTERRSATNWMAAPGGRGPCEQPLVSLLRRAIVTAALAERLGAARRLISLALTDCKRMSARRPTVRGPRWSAAR